MSDVIGSLPCPNAGLKLTQSQAHSEPSATSPRTANRAERLGRERRRNDQAGWSL